MNVNIKTELNNELLATVNGGIKGPASKYDLGQTLRVLDYNNNEVIGVIYEEVFSGRDLEWTYMIRDTEGKLIGSFSEESILGVI